MKRKINRTWQEGEQEVCDLIPCPNCGKTLERLGKNNPIYDIRCEKCFFVAQVKSPNKKPGGNYLGSGWDIMYKHWKCGYLIPSVFGNHKWYKGDTLIHEIRFFPFVFKENLKKRTANIKSENRIYDMFNYYHMNRLPFFVLYRNEKSV